MITKKAYNNFFNSVKEKLSNKDKLSKRTVETLAKTFDITDKNTIKEITENAIVTIAREIANQPNKTVKEKYNEIVALYNSQVNLSQRTSQSMLLQQYSTPATLGYLMGVYCGVNKPGNYLEPSAGNGMLTIANTGKDFTVNEIDKVRYENLQHQNVFKKITKQDASEDIFKSKSFDAVISNPPFASLKDKEDWLTVGGYTIKHLDHKMAINALKSLKDNGKAAIIVGGHTNWDAKGRIQAGKNRIFLSYLYKHYNVDDIILIDGHALYSKMGTAFNTRIILINGRKDKPSGFAPLKTDKLATVIENHEDLFKRFSENFENELTIDDILNDPIITDQFEKDEAELKKAGWSRKDIQGVADFVVKKQSVISVPVISYKANGNDVIKIKRKIKPYRNFKNLFLQEKTDKWGNYKAVLKVVKNDKVAYFVEGSYSLDNFKKITQQLIDNRIERVFNDIKIDNKPRYVRNLEIEIAKELGVDTKPLEQLKERFLNEKNKISEAQRKKTLEIEKEAAAYEKEQKEQELLQAEKDLLNEKYVDGDLIIDLAKKYDIKIHIRTIGAIRKNNVSFQLQKGEKRNSFNYSFTRKRGKAGYKVTDPSFFYELVDFIENKITDKEWKELTTPKNSLKSEKENEVVLKNITFLKKPFISKTISQFDNIKIDDFIELIKKAKDLTNTKIKLIKKNNATIIDESKKDFIVKQGNTRTKIQIDEDFNISELAYNIFSSIIAFRKNKKLFDYDFLKYKKDLQREYDVLIHNISISEYFIKNQNQKKSKKMSLLEKINKIKAQQKELLKNDSEGLGMPYIPASQSCFTLNVDTPDSMSFEIHNAIKKIKAAVGGSLNDYLVKKLKYPNEAALCKALAAEQIDGVATAIYNIEEKQQGIIIGDQTGIGKGRQAASIVRYAHKNGMLPIFLTEKPNLFTDLYRDLEDINTADLVPFIVNAKSTKTNIKNNAGKVIIQAPDKAKQNRAFEKGIVPNDYDFVCATYSQFASSKPTLKQSWLRKIVFNKKCIVIMDESHNASGSSATGEFLKDIVKQSVSTIFLSATFAKRPDNMPIYALKTSIQDANMSDENLVDAITNGGVALQEVLASQLVLEGQMIRRERSYQGIQVNYLTLDRLKQQHIKVADAITDIIRRMIGFQAAYVDDMVEQLDKIAVAENKEVEVTKGTQQAGVDNTPYFSRVFNVINQMLFSIKADEVANLCIQRLEEGFKPVIAFSNTMGAFIDDEPIDTIIEADFKEVLKRGLESVTSYTTTDDAGNKVKEYFTPAQMDQEARASYYDILDRIEKVSTGIVVSPIDHIVQKIEKAGYKTAEVTGRKKMVQLNYTKNGIVGEIQVRKKINTNDAFRDFNNNEVDVLLINQSGSTGASAHAIPTKKVPESEVKPRVMIVLQAELNINTEVQKRGRINRTGQILKPQYDYVASAIPAEQRLQMMLQKKLKSLDANTTSNQKNSEDLLKSDDFLNKYGDEIVKTWLEENPEMNRLLGNIITEDTKNFTNLAHKTSGRVAILPVVEQERFYKTILDQYHTELQRLIQTGQYDLEVENINLEAETLEKKVVVVGKTSNSIFGGNTYLEKCEVNNLSKPFTKSEIIEMLEANNYQNATATKNQMVEKYDTYVEGELAKIFVAKSEKWEKVKKNITKEKGYDKANDQQQYYNARVDAIEKALEDDIENAKNKFKNQSNMIRRFLNFFYVGRGVKVPIASYGSGSELIDGVVLNSTFNENADNPFTPSNITFSVAVANSNRRLDFKASGKFQQDINGIISQSYYLNEQRSQNILENWDLSAKESNVNRRRAYIITGNILQGYAKYDKGKLVSYTLKGGGIEKGILMPSNWQPNNSFGSSDNSVNVPIYKALKFVMSTSSGGVIRTNTPLTLQRYYGSVRLYAPASRKQGGKFYLDENILPLTQENNFEKIGNKMTAYVDDDNIPELLKILQNAHGVSALVPQTRVDEIEAITDAINDAKKLEVKTNNSSKAKQLKLKAKMVIALQKQLLIAS